MIIKLINIASMFSTVQLRVRFTVVWQAWWRDSGELISLLRVFCCT